MMTTPTIFSLDVGDADIKEKSDDGKLIQDEMPMTLKPAIIDAPHPEQPTPMSMPEENLPSSVPESGEEMKLSELTSSRSDRDVDMIEKADVKIEKQKEPTRDANADANTNENVTEIRSATNASTNASAADTTLSEEPTAVPRTPIAPTMPTASTVSTPAVPLTSESTTEVPPALLKKQLDFCMSIMRTMKRHKEAGMFMQPVDPVALNIPDYYDIIKNPMDFGTITTKLQNHAYGAVEDFVSDMKLVFSNCYRYNPEGHPVNAMGKNVEGFFNKQLSRMPTTLTPSRPSSNISYHDELLDRPRRASASKRRSDSPDYGSPLSKTPSRRQSQGGKRNPLLEDLRYLTSVIKSFFKAPQNAFSYPFLQPVDPIALNIPDYFTVIKQPMDLATIRHHCENSVYESPEDIDRDVRLMLNNCYLYNGPESDVSKLARALESFWSDKWARRPSLRVSLDDDLGLDDIDERIRQKNVQMQSLQNELSDLVAFRAARKAALESKSVKSTHSIKRKPSEKKSFSFEEKRKLSIDINELDPDKLGRVIDIINQSMPNLRDNADSDEIELDIESLDISTLYKLARYVKQCKMEAMGKGYESKGGLGMDLDSEDESDSD